jgi:peptidyl-prolyl cis-trans isomerase SurA
MKSKSIALLIFCLCVSPLVRAQQTIDRVVAVVAGNIILESEINSQYNQYLGMGYKPGNQTRCTILEDLMYQKLLLDQSAHDSIKVTEAQVDQEIDRKLKYYIQQFKSVEKFEEFNGKSVEAFKADIRDRQKEYLLSQQEQSKITGDITVSPIEVKNYFNSMNPDSVPFVNSEIEIGQIVKKPEINPELRAYAKQKIEEERKKIISGQIDFCAAAAAISDDPGSRMKCGEYDHVQLGQFDPRFEAVAFHLKKDSISEVFETDFGYHIVQLLERRGDEVDVRHILVAVTMAPSDMVKCRAKLDSIRQVILKDTIKFCDAAAKYSDDKDTKNSCGLLVNPQTGTTLFEMDLLSQIDVTILTTLDQMKPGDISPSVPYQTRDAKQAYRILCLRKRSEPHKENLKDDFPKIQEAALAHKQQLTIKNWVNRKLATTYVTICEDYRSCNFENNWAKNPGRK